MGVESRRIDACHRRWALSRAALTAGQAVADDPALKSGRLSAEVLAKVPLFAGVPARHVRRIAALGSAANFDAKTRIVSAGDPGDAFYVLLVGRAEVQRGRGRANVEIGPGAYFGEMALLDGAPRSATVVAKSETTCLMLARKQFEKVLKDEPAVAYALLRTLAARLCELDASAAD
jgi:CRP/FNR family cyclic AMP-dependent transcriptional regulator